MGFSLTRWVLLVATAETVGFLVPVTALATTSGDGTSPWARWACCALAGSVEGAALGWGQSTAVRGTTVAVAPRPWILATAVGAAIAWALGMLPSTLSDAGVAVNIGSPVTLVAVMVGGAVVLLSIPVAQTAVLSRHQVHTQGWIAVNLLAWTIGVGWTLVPGPFVDAQTSGVVLATTFVAAGVAMAVTVAVITGVWWRHRSGVGFWGTVGTPVERVLVWGHDDPSGRVVDRDSGQARHRRDRRPARAGTRRGVGVRSGEGGSGRRGSGRPGT